jgi:multimeric flavodoxin WrbA
MKIVSINGAMGTQDETGLLIDAVVAQVRLQMPELEHQALSVRELQIVPCEMTCASFCAQSEFTCRLEDDVNGILSAMEQADVVIIGAPLYFRVPSAKFHMLAERLISIFYNRERSGGMENVHSPLYNNTCVLIGVAEYTSPNQVLEYLQEFCHVLKMRPVMLSRFPYLGIGAQGPLEADRMFQPLERAVDMGDAVWNAIHEPHRHRPPVFTSFDEM